MAEKKKDKATTDGVINAIFRVNLHCPQCASQIKKPLLRTEGVHSVDADFEKGEIKVKGVFDVIKIHKQIEKLSKKKVELVSPKIKITEKEKAAATVQKKVKEPEEVLHTTSMKVHLHCDKCEEDLRKKLLKHKGIFNVKTDMKAQTLTVHGTIKPDNLLSYIRKNVHKYAEIISSKEEVKEQKKVEKKEQKKVEKKESGKEEKKKESGKEEKKKESGKEEKKESGKEEKKEESGQDEGKSAGKSSEKTELIEFKEFYKEEVIVKSKDDNAPYFVHYVYAPQLFSDENPNACCII